MIALGATLTLVLAACGGKSVDAAPDDPGAGNSVADQTPIDPGPLPVITIPTAGAATPVPPATGTAGPADTGSAGSTGGSPGRSGPPKKLTIADAVVPIEQLPKGLTYRYFHGLLDRQLMTYQGPMSPPECFPVLLGVYPNPATSDIVGTEGGAIGQTLNVLLAKGPGVPRIDGVRNLLTRCDSMVMKDKNGAALVWYMQQMNIKGPLAKNAVAYRLRLTSAGSKTAAVQDSIYFVEGDTLIAVVTTGPMVHELSKVFTLALQRKRAVLG